jgi:hypothetical protein
MGDDGTAQPETSNYRLVAGFALAELVVAVGLAAGWSWARPRGDGGVLQTGRERVPEIVRAVQLQVGQRGLARLGLDCRPALRLPVGADPGRQLYGPPTGRERPPRSTGGDGGRAWRVGRQSGPGQGRGGRRAPARGGGGCAGRW